MRRRIRFRLTMFLVLFVAICAAAVAMDAWAEREAGGDALNQLKILS